MRNGAFVKSTVLAAAVAAVSLAALPAQGAARQAADAGVCPEAQRCLELLQDGIEFITAGRWEVASIVLEEAAAGLEGQPSHARDLARAYVYLGVARLQVADAAETVQWFAEAQMRDPTLQLDPGEFPGDVLELWAEARELGMLVVDSEPSGAEVSVDGVARGRSPVGVAGLRPGQHRVTLAHAGYAGVSRVLAVVAGRTERLFFSLLPASGGEGTRAGAAAPLTGTPDGISTTVGPSFGDAAVEQAPVNVLPIPARFPAGTTKKSGRSWWRTLAGLLGAAGGVAMMVETAQCRPRGGEIKIQPGGRQGRTIEALGGTLLATFPNFLKRCKLEYWWSLDVPDRGRFVGWVPDHELVQSGTYKALSDPNFALFGGQPELLEEMRQDPSFAERVNQGLIQSVGEVRPRHRVPKEYLLAGGAMIAAGTLLATIWSDVTLVEDLAVSVTPRGGVLASRSFGW